MVASCEIINHRYTIDEEQLPFEASADLVFADPPYNIGVKYEDDQSRDSLDPDVYFQLIQNTICNLKKVSRPGATIWWVCPEEHADKIGPMLTNHFGPRLYRIVWHETFSQYNRHDLTQDYRFIFCHVNDTVGDRELEAPFVHYPFNLVTKNLDDIRVPSARMLMGDKRAKGPKIPGRVWRVRRLQGTSKDRVDWHPAQISPELLSKIVRGWTNEGDTVLDAFAGSGSMGIECQKLGRHFVGVDSSQTYCTKMRDRLDPPRNTSGRTTALHHAEGGQDSVPDGRA